MLNNELNLDVHVIQYRFNILNLTIADIKRMDVKTKSSHTPQHLKTDVDRLHVPSCEGGRGLI